MQLQRILRWGFSLAVPTLIACGSSKEAEHKGDSPALVPMNTSYKPGSRTFADDEERDDGLRVEMEHGVLDQNEVESTIERSFRKLTRCYDRAGDAQSYVGGQVTLRFLVEPNGEVSDVLIIENDLGSYAVERCLVVELRDIKFRAPGGRKGATFEFPIRFRSTGEVAVVDWPRGLIREDVEPLMDAFTPCPPLGSPEVFAITYIEPSGAIGSAGLVSAGPIDPEAGKCALEQIHAWRLRGETGHVIRTSFRLRVPDATRPEVTRPAPAGAGKKSRARPGAGRATPPPRQGRRPARG